MILNALVNYYDALYRQGKISAVGFKSQRVSAAIVIDEKGNLISVIDLTSVPEGGKKALGKPMDVPVQTTRSSGVFAYFLCDNAQYILGMPKSNENGSEAQKKKDIKDALKKHEASAFLHTEILKSIQKPAAAAVISFFEKWDPAQAMEYACIRDHYELLLTGNIIFRTTDGIDVQSIPEIRNAWIDYQNSQNADSEKMICLVTGERDVPARLHPNIKNIRGGSSMGNQLVSFNASAFESYGNNGAQGLNSPVSMTAADKYGNALNYLLADRNHVMVVGDCTIVFWADTAEEEYQDLFGSLMNDGISDDSVKNALKQLLMGLPTEFGKTELQPGTGFHILGLAPNSARLVVRMYMENTFGAMMKNVEEHCKRLEIKQANGIVEQLPIWRLVSETVRKTETGKNAKAPAGPLVANTIQAILQNYDYPAALYQNVLIRINAEKDIKWTKAAIIKAVLLKNRDFRVPEEVLDVELNKESTYVPYVLGELFAVLEKVQKDANPSLNATIKDRYFTSACDRPAVIYPQLLKLNQHHLRKLDNRIYHEKQIQELTGKLHEPFPQHLNLKDQGVWYLGYYHKVQEIYTKKNVDKKEG